MHHHWKRRKSYLSILAVSGPSGFFRDESNAAAGWLWVVVAVAVVCRCGCGCGVCCVCCVWGDTRWKTSCVRSKRSVCTGNTSTCVNTCGVVPVQTGTFWTYTRWRFEWTHGVQGVIVSSAYVFFSHVASRAPEVQQRNLAPIFSLRTGQEQHVPDSSNHSRYTKHVTRNRSQDHGKQIYMYKYLYIYIYIFFLYIYIYIYITETHVHANIYMYVPWCVLFKAFHFPQWFHVFFLSYLFQALLQISSPYSSYRSGEKCQ